MRYRRSNIAGATYFITANLADRRARTLVDHIALLRNALRTTRARHSFTIDAMVVLPEHLHLLMALPPDDADFSMRVRGIKAAFSKHLPRDETINASRAKKANAVFGSADFGNI